MACMDHLSEFIIALTPLVMGLAGMYVKLKNEIKCNNGHSAAQTEEVKKLIEAFKQATRSD